MGLVHLKVSLLLVFGESRCLLSICSFLPLTLSLLQIYPVIFQETCMSHSLTKIQYKEKG